MSRRASTAIALLVLWGCTPQPAADSVGQLVVVMDGLRPDYVTAELMPNLHALGQRGVVFADHHSVFPTVTRVNAAAIVTGSYPARDGLLGNEVYIPEVDSRAILNTAEKATLERIEAATGGRLLTAPTLGELLAASGKRLLALSSGSQGSGFLLNHRTPAGAIVHPDYTVPDDLRARIDDRLGAGPTGASPVEERTRWVVDVFLSVGLDEVRPDVSLLWMGTVDTAAHASGVGTPATLDAIRQVDAEFGRLLAGLRERDLLDRMDVLVTADHGFSTHSAEFDPDRDIERAVTAAGADPASVVRAEGALYVHDPDLVPAIVEALQRDPAAGPIFTPSGDPDADAGTAPGTLSLGLAHWNHARAGQILVSAAWTDEVNPEGYPGIVTSGGVAGHGSTSPFDIHATLIAAGPDYREGLESPVPTANVDLAPTLLHLAGLAVPLGMDGRVLSEAFRDGPAPDTVQVVRNEHTARVDLAGGLEYAVTARTSTVRGHRYLDWASATRR